MHPPTDRGVTLRARQYGLMHERSRGARTPAELFESRAAIRLSAISSPRNAGPYYDIVPRALRKGREAPGSDGTYHRDSTESYEAHDRRAPDRARARCAPEFVDVETPALPICSRRNIETDRVSRPRHPVSEHVAGGDAKFAAACAANFFDQQHISRGAWRVDASMLHVYADSPSRRGVSR